MHLPSRSSDPAAVRVRRVAGLLALLLAACGGETGDAASGAPNARAEPDLRIGAVEGEGADVFGRVGGIAVDAGGRIVVVDAQAHDVRVFAPDGRHLYSFGRQGAGPGELSGPCCLAVAPDGLLWVRDGGNARYNAYRLDADGAEFVTSMRMHHSDVNRWAPLTFDANGSLVDIGTRPLPDGALATYRFHRAADGSVTREQQIEDPPATAVPVHTVRRQVADGFMTLYLVQPFGARHLVAHGPGGRFADAVSSSYVVQVYGSDGVATHTLARTDVTPPRLSAGERERAAATLESQAARLQIPISDVPFGVPERKQPLRHLDFDAEGNLWVFLEAAEDAPRQADVYDPAGTWIRTVGWTERVENFPLVLRPDGLYGVVRDSLDVPYVTRLRVR
jgi:hypothetical protein